MAGASKLSIAKDLGLAVTSVYSMRKQMLSTKLYALYWLSEVPFKSRHRKIRWYRLYNNIKLITKDLRQKDWVNIDKFTKDEFHVAWIRKTIADGTNGFVPDFYNEI
jgi:hypothetical protein